MILMILSQGSKETGVQRMDLWIQWGRRGRDGLREQRGNIFRAAYDIVQVGSCCVTGSSAQSP